MRYVGVDIPVALLDESDEGADPDRVIRFVVDTEATPYPRAIARTGVTGDGAGLITESLNGV